MTAQPSDTCRSPRRYRKAKQLRKGMAKSGHIFSFIMFSLIMKRNFYVTKMCGGSPEGIWSGRRFMPGIVRRPDNSPGGRGLENTRHGRGNGAAHTDLYDYAGNIVPCMAQRAAG